MAMPKHRLAWVGVKLALPRHQPEYCQNTGLRGQGEVGIAETPACAGGGKLALPRHPPAWIGVKLAGT